MLRDVIKKRREQGPNVETADLNIEHKKNPGWVDAFYDDLAQSHPQFVEGFLRSLE